ncbi:MAG: alanine dehydrogenase [Spirochaetota bacterium]
MIIGVAAEIKKDEYRVGLSPMTVKPFAKNGHRVLIEQNAGHGSGFEDSEYEAAGAEIISDKKSLFDQSELIIKVKEPLPEEYGLFHEGQILYTYLHLAAAYDLTLALLKRKIIGIAYETIELADGTLPLLTPMSEIAGRLAVQEGAKYLEKPFGGRGILLGGVPGIKRGKVVILGGGVVGLNACKMAVGLGADVTILDVDPKRLAYLDDLFSTHITTLYSTESNIEEEIQQADLVIGAVLKHGAKAPKLIERHHLKMMKKGAVLVDVSVDQGGCFESSRPTTHKEPVYVEEGIVHYAVANMPGAVALSSTIALTSVTYAYGLAVASKGLNSAIKESAALASGVNLYRGCCTYKNVADSLGIPYTPLAEAMAK